MLKKQKCRLSDPAQIAESESAFYEELWVTGLCTEV